MEIKAATENFHENFKISQGDFRSCIYKGFINDGTLAFAVKRLHPESLMGIHEFQNEVRLLCQLCHPNLVSLVGFCKEENEMIIVREYINNGTLHDHVHGSLSRDSFPWERRLEVCIGLARALDYLQSGVKYAIIHRYVKSSTIFLDENWTPKVSDFELSKMGPHSMSKALIRVDSAVMGAQGYADPAYVATGQLTEKSDVYSFGVVLLEILCGRLVINGGLEKDQIDLTEWARKCIENGTIYDIVDPYLKGKIAPECLGKIVEIAYSCISLEGRDRPTMGEVEVTLELALELQQKARAHSHLY
ncbi:hypothetical protein SLE2022_190590 [Rubroshorea leprosula]